MMGASLSCALSRTGYGIDSGIEVRVNTKRISGG
jgi:hypothetical protein